MTLFETEKNSRRKAAVIAGITLLVMAGAAAFTAGYVNGSLIVKGDAGATANNIFNSMSLYRGGIFGWFIILVSDVIVSWALYVFFKQAGKKLALLGAWLRITYCAILGAAIMNLFYAAQALSGGIPLESAQMISAQVMMFINAFNRMWSFGLIIFGLHLLVIGMLVFKSGFVPKIFGILLLIAAVSYVVVHMLHVFFPQAEQTTIVIENILSLPMALGELAFGVWLLIKGGRKTKSAAQ